MNYIVFFSVLIVFFIYGISAFAEPISHEEFMKTSHPKLDRVYNETLSPDDTLLAKLGGEIIIEKPDDNTNMQNKPELENGIYTKSKVPTQLLELGKEVDIVFAIKESMIGESTKAVIRYQILETQDEPFDTKDIREFPFDSLNSNEINFSFSPQEPGAFFLKQELNYSNDTGISAAGSSSVTPFHVVEKFNKKTNEDGLCMTSGMVSLFRPDFSSNVCITPTTAMKLMIRWHGQPDYLK